MFNGKRFAGEPRSDGADVGSSSDDSDRGVSADEGIVQRPGIRPPLGVVPKAAGERGSGRGAVARANDEGGGTQQGAGDAEPRHAGRQPTGAGASNPSSREGGGFKFTAPPSARPKAGEVGDPWRTAHAIEGGAGTRKRPLASRALSVPPRRARGEVLELAQSSGRGAGAQSSERPQRRDRTRDGESGPQRNRSMILPRGPNK